MQIDPFEFEASTLENSFFQHVLLQLPMIDRDISTIWLAKDVKHFSSIFDLICLDPDDDDENYENGSNVYNGPLTRHMPFFTTIDVDTWASTFWEEASVDFRNWWNSHWGEQYQARLKPFWGFMKHLCRMFENPSLDDEQLASHLWNIRRPKVMPRDSSSRCRGHHCI
uniref:Uncharacterized protein n=1 Tax=Romanomermis culicivorax TaxID=13658 RepID=A0A915JID6_ROMCU